MSNIFSQEAVGYQQSALSTVSLWWVCMTETLFFMVFHVSMESVQPNLHDNHSELGTYKGFQIP